MVWATIQNPCLTIETLDDLFKIGWEMMARKSPSFMVRWCLLANDRACWHGSYYFPFIFFPWCHNLYSKTRIWYVPVTCELELHCLVTRTSSPIQSHGYWLETVGWGVLSCVWRELKAGLDTKLSWPMEKAHSYRSYSDYADANTAWAFSGPCHYRRAPIVRPWGG